MKLQPTVQFVQLVPTVQFVQFVPTVQFIHKYSGDQIINPKGLGL